MGLDAPSMRDAQHQDRRNPTPIGNAPSSKRNAALPTKPTDPQTHQKSRARPAARLAAAVTPAAETSRLRLLWDATSLPTQPDMGLKPSQALRHPTPPFTTTSPPPSRPPSSRPGFQDPKSDTPSFGLSRLGADQRGVRQEGVADHVAEGAPAGDVDDVEAGGVVGGGDEGRGLLQLVVVRGAGGLRWAERCGGGNTRSRGRQWRGQRSR